MQGLDLTDRCVCGGKYQNTVKPIRSQWELRHPNLDEVSIGGSARMDTLLTAF
jgi:hypothetical protein